MLAKATDLVGIIIIAWMAFNFGGIFNDHQNAIGGVGAGEEGGAYFGFYLALVIAFGLFVSCLQVSNRKVPIKQWKLERFVAWPLVLIAYGIRQLLISVS